MRPTQIVVDERFNPPLVEAEQCDLCADWTVLNELYEADDMGQVCPRCLDMHEELTEAYMDEERQTWGQ